MTPCIFAGALPWWHHGSIYQMSGTVYTKSSAGHGRHVAKYARHNKQSWLSLKCIPRFAFPISRYIFTGAAKYNSILGLQKSVMIICLIPLTFYRYHSYSHTYKTCDRRGKRMGRIWLCGINMLQVWGI